MRLIDADSLKIGISEKTKTSSEASRFIDIINEQPTAFDLENLIKCLETKRNYCYSEMERERNREDWLSGYVFDEFHNKAIAYNDALEIIKSGLNTETEDSVVKQEMCDNYCKYASENSEIKQEELYQICEKCPLTQI